MVTPGSVAAVAVTTTLSAHESVSCATSARNGIVATNNVDGNNLRRIEIIPEGCFKCRSLERVGSNMQGRNALQFAALQWASLTGQYSSVRVLWDKPISTREELVDYLTVAAELEHTFLVQYLFAAFSLKTSWEKEGRGLHPSHEEKLKSWKCQILHVAREEMAHLGTVCNLLSAIGAAAHFKRPNFPQAKDTCYPFSIELLPFSAEAIHQFIRYELPQNAEPPPPPGILPHLVFELVSGLRRPVEYEFVGELYRKIGQAFDTLGDANLFVGPEYAQDTDNWSRRLQLHLVADRAGAAKAINSIILEGEGSRGNPGESHYATFLSIFDELGAEHAGFEPARKVISNPRTWKTHFDASIPGNLITHPDTLGLAETFNDVYEIALLMLMQYYSFSGETLTQRKALQEACHQIMTIAIRPLGEILTELPAYTDGSERRAGAPFEFYSTLRLSTQLKTRWVILLERLQHSAEDIRALARLHPRLAAVARNLGWLRENIEDALRKEFALEPKAKLAPKPFEGQQQENQQKSRPSSPISTLCLKFSGWFQCRLATNPSDPPDEPRGASGFTFAVVGEPNLDRIIRFQRDGATWRFGCPEIGVTVNAVYKDGKLISAHPLSDAKVEFLDDAKFIGENGIVADPNEPIIPLHISISNGALHVRRHYADNYEFPFDHDLFGKETTYCPGEISEATGVSDLAHAWQRRIGILEQKLQTTSDKVEHAALTMRVNAMRKGIQTGLTRMFYGKMPYYIPLVGTVPLVEDPNHILKIDMDKDKQWQVEFWMGGWDADGLCGFVRGFVTIPTL